jgi:hypothetical protein
MSKLNFAFVIQKTLQVKTKEIGEKGPHPFQTTLASSLQFFSLPGER